jgi:hypothetical protein
MRSFDADRLLQDDHCVGERISECVNHWQARSRRPVVQAEGDLVLAVGQVWGQGKTVEVVDHSSF